MTHYFAPLRAESAEPLALDMQSLFLSGTILPFGAQLSVEHVFRSSEKTPVEVVYCFPLPADASLTGFQVAGEGFLISSRLEARADAEKRYEQALANGSLAAATLQNLDGLVNLTLGNLRAGETVSVRLDLVAGVSLSDGGFQLRFPFTVAPCYHVQMRASLGRPGVGTVELPGDVAGGAFLPPFHADAAPLHRIGFDLQIEPAVGVGEIASPSHAVRVILEDRHGVRVKLFPHQDVPDRDLVLTVKRDCGVGEVWCDRPADGRKRLAVVVPSSTFGRPSRRIRRVVFLLDRSGSMDGTPIAQARRALESCLRQLSPQDQFGIVTFADQPQLFRKGLLSATANHVAAARTFLKRIETSGGTELAAGVEAAARLLAGSPGEIFAMTDGQVSGVVEILRRVRKCEIRVFCLAIGGASQDRFLELLARQTGGTCRFAGWGEPIDEVSSQLFATVAAEVRLMGVEGEPPPAGRVFSGTPFLAFGEIDAHADEVEIHWPQGSRRLPLKTLGRDFDGLIEKLQGARCIADLEARVDFWDPAECEKLLKLSQRYGLASFAMSLMAIVERAGDAPGDVPKTKIVPVSMPHDTKFGSYFPQWLKATKDSGIRFRVAYDEPAIGEEALLRLGPACRRATGRDLLTVLRDAIQMVEGLRWASARKEVNGEVDALLTDLVEWESGITDESRAAALGALLDFLSGALIDFLDTGQPCLEHWQNVRQSLAAAWPELLLDGAEVTDDSRSER